MRLKSELECDFLCLRVSHSLSPLMKQKVDAKPRTEEGKN